MNIKFRKIVLTLSIIFCIMFFTNYVVEAAEASISATSPALGDNVTVTVNLPAETFAYEGAIVVTFSNGTSVTSEQYASFEGQADFTRTLSFSTKADIAGKGTAKIQGLILSNAQAQQINSNSTVSTSFTVTCNHTYSDWTTQSHNPAVQERKCSACGDTTYRDTPGYTPPVQNTTTPEPVNNTVVNETKPVNNTTVTNTTTNEVKNEVKEEIVVTIKREVKSTMYVDPEVSSCNVRNADSTKAEIIGGLRSGNKVQVTGITSNGWYRIKYGSGVGYVYDEALTDEEPVENEVVNNTTVNNTVNNVVENELENTTDNSFENEIDILENTIGVIPEVGNNITNVLFIVVTIISLGYVFYLSYKNREV